MGDTYFPVDKPASKDSGIRNVPFLAFSRHWLAADRMFVGLGQTQLSINTNATDAAETHHIIAGWGNLGKLQ